MDLRIVQPHENLDAYLELELLASATYVDFVYGGAEIGRRIHRRLVEAGAGEFASPHGKLALDTETGEPVGMITAPLDAKALGRARLGAASQLMRDPEFASNPEFRARAVASRSAYAALGPGDAYLSRVAVASSARRRGVGRELLRWFVHESRKLGARRALLEVSPHADAAVGMYEAAGFANIGEARAEAGSSTLAYRHLALTLAPQSEAT